MRTANPALRQDTFQPVGVPGTPDGPPLADRRMTVEGTVNKSALLLLLVAGTAGVVAAVGTTDGEVASWVPVASIAAALVGLVVALLTIFKPERARVTAPVYALVEGVVVGGFSTLFETRYPGIVVQAVALTFAVAAGMLVAYRTGLIKVTQTFRNVVVAATGAILLVYLVSFGLSLFGVAVPILNDSGPLGILVSLVIVGVAALNLVLDFDLIAGAAERGAPASFEWYGAFALTVTLVWLYLELLRLLGKLRR